MGQGFALADEAATLSRLQKDVLPLLSKYCLECHDSEMRKADINLELLTDAKAARLDVRLWDKVEEQLRTHLMPPKKKEKPPEEGRKVILEWIAAAADTVREKTPSDPGYRKARRLTRTEYSLSVRDVLGCADRLGETFPADGAGGEGFDNNADTLTIPSLLIEKYLEAADLGLTEAWKRPESLARLLVTRPSPMVSPPAAAKVNLEKLARRAYRRPLTDADTAPLLAVFEQATKRGLDFDAAMRVAFKAVLMSPKFLILQEEDRPGEPTAWRISSHEMATRLSYFLWSTLPDETLTRLADAGQLQEPRVIEAQVKRMLEDKRAQAFIQNFAGQWLGLPELFNTVDPDRGKYPEFTPSLRQAMYDEGMRFADAILRGNGRVLEFIDSDYTYVNEELAKFYGVPGVQGPDMRRVTLPDARRGGLLGMGAILAATAYPQRTSPVLRGKWVLEQLLGTPAPPPPANVGSLPEDDRNLKELTFRQQLEKHRSREQCMGCHNRLDPPGFGLENFDPIGKWRDAENGKPLDTRGNLPDGRSFTGPAEMRKMLMQEKAKFVRNFCRRLLGYALERGLEPCDQPTLLRLEATLAKSEYRSLPAIIAVAQSFPFTHRRNSETR
ncbi:MAG: DUF1592 domain-containing protein [Prosthecobacter sp.]|nr:DUF1592 domain-containing protein [Prosthecobacter sp.]